MSKKPPSALADLVRSLSIRAIRPTELYAALVKEPPGPGADVETSVDFNLKFERESWGFAYIWKAKISMSNRGEQIAVFRYRYRIEYGAPADKLDTKDDLLRRFGQTSGMLHLWPYLRTQVDTACVQFHLPVAPLPPLLMGGAPEKRDTE